MTTILLSLGEDDFVRLPRSILARLWTHARNVHIYGSIFASWGFRAGRFIPVRAYYPRCWTFLYPAVQGDLALLKTADVGTFYVVAPLPGDHEVFASPLSQYAYRRSYDDPSEAIRDFESLLSGANYARIELVDKTLRDAVSALIDRGLCDLFLPVEDGPQGERRGVSIELVRQGERELMGRYRDVLAAEAVVVDLLGRIEWVGLHEIVVGPIVWRNPYGDRPPGGIRQKGFRRLLWQIGRRGLSPDERVLLGRCRTSDHLEAAFLPPQPDRFSSLTPVRIGMLIGTDIVAGYRARTGREALRRLRRGQSLGDHLRMPEAVVERYLGELIRLGLIDGRFVLTELGVQLAENRFDGYGAILPVSRI